MKLDHLILIGDAVEKIHELTETHIPDIVDALTGIAWDEEDAGQIKAYHAGEYNIPNPGVHPSPDASAGVGGATRWPRTIALLPHQATASK